MLLVRDGDDIDGDGIDDRVVDNNGKGWKEWHERSEHSSMNRNKRAVADLIVCIVECWLPCDIVEMWLQSEL